ncbi:F0F1 ATP synthase subunit B [Parachitinimonas caeni]|uniref:ATP synthase subunit b n=1 Tax=Parachitinimonas caeni TaxID=3031301 RepID=A0ABT7DR39_9NEIS|nr:F0F1 ATP synthase subunit B [Parachitinimonas caeni]MDK2122538.1 F0F1 ATP synthase subunit B [Parachitinimonas caeni]
MQPNASLFGQALVFAILVLFTWKFIWPPLIAALEERAKRIADGLSAADKAKNDLELVEKRIAEELRKAKTQAAEIIAQAEKRAAQIVDEAKDEGRAAGEREKAAAQAEIEQQAHHAREELRQQVSLLAIAGAEKILRKEIDSSRHADLLASLKSEL